MDRQGYIEAIGREGGAMAVAAEGSLDAPVDSCPGWDVRTLLAHTGEVHRFWRQIVERKLQDPREVDRSDTELPDGRDLIEWFRDGIGLLNETLADVDESQPIWSNSPVKKVAFVPRRMAQETAVHRWDAQSPAGDPQPIEPELAADGIDEMLDVFLVADDQENLAGDGELIHLHRTDGQGEWLIRLGPDGAEVSRGHEKGDVAVRGTASDLLLMLWGRIPWDRLETFGDPAVLETYFQKVDLE